MAQPEFDVTPFGDRWIVAQGLRRLSIHPTFDQAISAATALAHRATSIGEEALIRIREREGSWRELTYLHRPQYIGRRRGIAARATSIA